MHRINSFFRLAIYLYILLLFNFIFFYEIQDDLVFYLLSIYLLVISFIEVYLLFKLKRFSVFLIPPVLATILYFGLFWGISNIIFLPFFSNGDSYSLRFIVYSQFYWLKIVQYWAVIAFISMWFGYYLYSISDRIFALFRKIFFLDKTIRQNFKTNDRAIIIILILSTLSKLLSLKLGIYGWNSSGESVDQFKGFSYFLYLGNSVSQLCLFLISLNYFRNKEKKYKNLFYLTFSLEMFFGLLTGMKGAIIYPFIVSGFAYFLLKRQVKLKIFIYIILFIIIAYAIIEPYRSVYGKYRSINRNIDVTELLGNYYDAFTNPGFSQQVNSSTSLDAFLMRQNLSGVTAVATALSIGRNTYYPEFEEFKKLIYSPAMGLVPRFIWKNKPESDSGSLFNTIVLKNPYGTSISPSTLGYVVLSTGSFIYIIPLFILIGIFQRIIYKFFLYGGGAIFIYISMLLYVVAVNEPNSPFTIFFKQAPLYILAQYFMLKK